MRWRRSSTPPTWASPRGPSLRAQRVGFDIGINVSDAAASTQQCTLSSAGYRLGQYFLRVLATSPAAPYEDEAAFCTAPLR